ncbi:hypothetical protein [Thalassobacillus pellis]|uniref:hypothetical protein n=1 Tax=Thalassobacillus pellis TaxID=748008 RepID=UPI0019613A5D|nr:hypothetical protein [Thalassobacillus pellis]MBM7554962.1 hypothetical protein [Thalassobacillus pellis]
MAKERDNKSGEEQSPELGIEESYQSGSIEFQKPNDRGRKSPRSSRTGSSHKGEQ